jgi:hypothetical protein
MIVQIQTSITSINQLKAYGGLAETAETAGATHTQNEVQQQPQAQPTVAAISHQPNRIPTLKLALSV